MENNWPQKREIYQDKLMGVHNRENLAWNACLDACTKYLEGQRAWDEKAVIGFQSEVTDIVSQFFSQSEPIDVKLLDKLLAEKRNKFLAGHSAKPELSENELTKFLFGFTGNMEIANKRAKDFMAKFAAPAKQELDRDAVLEEINTTCQGRGITLGRGHIAIIADALSYKFQPPKMKLPSVDKLLKLAKENDEGYDSALTQELLEEVKAIRALIEKEQP